METKEEQNQNSQGQNSTKQINCDMFLDSARKIYPGFVTDNDNRNVIDMLIGYISGQNVKLDPDKGIFLHGLVGCGKTILIKALLTAKDSRYLFVTSRQIRDEYLVSGINAIWPYRGKSFLIIDDIGLEGSSKHFGNELSAVNEVILDRYEFWQGINKDKNCLTFLTSNCTAKDLHEIYGERFTSRLREMCNDIYLPGGDRRK